MKKVPPKLALTQGTQAVCRVESTYVIVCRVDYTYISTLCTGYHLVLKLKDSLYRRVP